MKQLYLHIKLAALSMLLFSACTQDEIMNQANVEKPITDGLLSIGSVKVDDFTENTESRVINDSKTVTFEAGIDINDANGDELGVLLIDESGETYANVAFKYVNENGENKWLNKTNEYYSSKIKKAIAYFPYTEIAKDLPSSIKELKQIFLSKDVSFEEKDLLVSETTEFHAASMDINFTHAFSMLTFSAEATTTTSKGNKITYSLQLSDVAFSIGDNLYTPELVNGKYVCLIDNETLAKDEFRYFYTANNTPYVKTVSNETPLILEANKSYSFPCPINTGEGTAMAVGDFYCVSSDDVLVLPGNAAGIPEGWTCKGIVFYTMNQATFESYASTNSLTANDYPGYNNNHGLIISLKDGGPLGSASSFENFLLRSIEGWNNKESLNGYKITQAMQEAVKDGTIISFTALNNHEEPASSATTSWFAPSFKELSILIRGGDGTTATGEGRAYINQQLQEIGSTTLGEGNIPSITFESQESPTQQNIVWFVTGKDGAEFSYPFTNTTPGESFRPICAF